MKKSEAALVTINKGMNIDPKNPLCKFHRASILFSMDKHQVWILWASTLFSVLFFCYRHVVLIEECKGSFSNDDGEDKKNVT